MVISKLKNCRPIEESMTEVFMNDPEFADYLMNNVIADGDEKEIAYFQSLYDEAKSTFRNAWSCERIKNKREDVNISKVN